MITLPDETSPAGEIRNPTQAANDELFIGRPVLGKVSKRWTIQLSRRIAAADGRVLGVVVASLDAGYFEDLYRGVRLGQHGGVTLIGVDQVVRVRVVGGVAQGIGTAVGSGGQASQLQGPRGHFESVSQIDGQRRLVAYERVGDYPLYVAVLRQTDEALAGFADTYSAAASDIVAIMNAASTTANTVVNHQAALESLLLDTVGFAGSGTNLLGATKDDLVDTINSLEPTTNLLDTYSPSFACTLQGATWLLDHSKSVWAPDDRTFVLDVALLPGNDPYAYPENLPKVAARGGPGGRPGCGSLPDATRNFPVRQLITDTGWGTGVDIRPNPGIGHPCWVDFFPVTRAAPQPPSLRQCLPGPAPGPQPYPGAPPYGAAQYGAGGVPLWPGVPPVQPSDDSTSGHP